MLFSINQAERFFVVSTDCLRSIFSFLSVFFPFRHNLESVLSRRRKQKVSGCVPVGDRKCQLFTLTRNTLLQFWICCCLTHPVQTERYFLLFTGLLQIGRYITKCGIKIFTGYISLWLWIDTVINQASLLSISFHWNLRTRYFRLPTSFDLHKK